MHFIYGYPLMSAPNPPEFLTGQGVGDLSAAAEAAGWHAGFFTEHPAPAESWRAGGGHDALDPFVALTYAAAVTTTFRLLTNLTVLPYRNPFFLAKTAATLDRLSGGRLILGAGTGYLKTEFRAMGVDFDERNDLFDESLEVLKLAWSGETVSYEGRHFSARDITCQPTPVSEPHVPIWLGGNSKLTRRRVATKTQGWMPIPVTEAFSKFVRSPKLESIAELTDMLDYMRSHVPEGESQERDIMFMALEGGTPGQDDFDVAHHRNHIAELEAAGVTHLAVNGVGQTMSEALAFIEQYGSNVIGA